MLLGADETVCSGRMEPDGMPSPPAVFVPEVVQMVPDDDEEIEDEWLDAETQTEGDATASALQITAQVQLPQWNGTQHLPAIHRAHPITARSEFASCSSVRSSCSG